MTVEERLAVLEQKAAQCEADVKALAEALGKFTDGLSQLQQAQQGLIAVVAQVLPQRRPQ